MTIEASPCVLADGYWRLPPGKLANATFWLEMSRRPPRHDATSLRLQAVATRNTLEVRDAFHLIGAPWLWDRAAELNAGLTPTDWEHARNRLYFAFDASNSHVGLIELALRDDEELEVEIAYLGLFPEATGRGLGKSLLAAALDAAWDLSPGRVHLHTCNTDHPTALPLYITSGFKAFATGFQIMSDPRLEGLLPRSVAPHIPVIDP